MQTRQIIPRIAKENISKLVTDIKMDMKLSESKLKEIEERVTELNEEMKRIKEIWEQTNRDVEDLCVDVDSLKKERIETKKRLAVLEGILMILYTNVRRAFKNLQLGITSMNVALLHILGIIIICVDNK